MTAKFAMSSFLQKVGIRSQFRQGSENDIFRFCSQVRVRSRVFRRDDHFLQVLLQSTVLSPTAPMTFANLIAQAEIWRRIWMHSL
jgi:hypothetical protein